MIKGRNKIHTITECALFSALICVLSPFVIPLGPVPFSLSLFAVMLTATVLTFKKSFIAVAVYIFAGCVGIPVFSGFQGGFSYLMGPTGGYIWSYLLVCSIISLSGKWSLGMRVVSAFVSLAVCYLAGTVQYMLVTGTYSLYGALLLCVVPFVAFDIVKLIGALILGTRIRNILIKQNLL